MSVTKSKKRTVKRSSIAEAPAKLGPGEPLPAEVVDLFVKHHKYLTAGKANYGRADKVLEQILERCEPGVEFILPAAGKQPPRKLTLVDQFAETNVVWAGSGCKRMKIEEIKVKPQDRASAAQAE